MRRAGIRAVALWLGAAVFAARAGDVLTVDKLTGSASLDRLGQHLELKAGDQINERDLIHVGEGSTLSLDFAGHGFVELGAGAELAIEKLPFASYADDLQTIFSLSRGYLRVVWQLVPDANWPLFVYFGTQHAGLVPGEYFFDSRPGDARACVAAGHLAVLPNAGGGMQKLQPSACYRFVGALAPERLPRELDGWITVRRSFSLDAPSSPEALLAESDAGAPAAAPAPPRPAPALPLQPRPAPPAPLAAAAPPLGLPPGPPPASKPAPQPPDPGATAGSGAWGINVASYPSQDDADKTVQQLRGAGYPAVALPAQVKGQTWYRVRLDGYGSVDAAHTAAVGLQNRFGYAGLWITRSGGAPAPAP